MEELVANATTACGSRARAMWRMPWPSTREATTTISSQTTAMEPR